MEKKNKLIFLGTGTSCGVPTIGCGCEVCRSQDPRDKRLRCSSLLQTGDKNILFDCGPDFRQQALKSGLRWADAILMTHAHADHVAGIDDLRVLPYAKNNWEPGMTEPERVQIYASPETNRAIRKMFYYCFPEEKDNQYRGMLPLLQQHDIDMQCASFTIGGGIEVTPVHAMHAYMPVLGYRIGSFAYLTDLKTIEPQELEKLRGLELLVLGMLRKEPHTSHLSLSEALQIVEQVKPRQTYFVHMSHDIGLHSETEAQLPEGTHLAYDGLEVCF